MIVFKAERKIEHEVPLSSVPLNVFINDQENIMNEEVTKSDDSINLFNIMKIIAAYEDLQEDLAILRFAKIQWQMIGLCKEADKNSS